MALCNPLIAHSSCPKLRHSPSNEIPRSRPQSFSLPLILPRSVSLLDIPRSHPTSRSLTWPFLGLALTASLAISCGFCPLPS
eukprot:15964562-Heterocapsa_arctica.AAC.1